MICCMVFFKEERKYPKVIILQARKSLSERHNFTMDAEVLERIKNSKIPLVKKMIFIWQLVSAVRIVRGYEMVGHHTERGENRISWSNVEQYFPAETFKPLFRFEFNQIKPLINCLKLPDQIIVGHRYTASSLEAILVVLRYLAFPVRYVDLSGMFDISVEHTQNIVSTVTSWIHYRVYPVLSSFINMTIFTEARCLSWSSCFREKSPMFADIIGIIDGSCFSITRPTECQRDFYCGHHSEHSYKVMFIVYPCGLIQYMGPWKGKQHDAKCLDDLDIQNKISQAFSFESGNHFSFLVDKGFRNTPLTVAPFRRRLNMTDQQFMFNRLHAQNRITVEWMIGHVKNCWKALKYRDTNRSMSTNLHHHLTTALHLYNLRSCFNGGNQITDYFQCEPITVEDYLLSF